MQSDPNTNINTDHKMLAIKVRQTLKAREEPNREHVKEYSQKKKASLKKKHLKTTISNPEN